MAGIGDLVGTWDMNHDGWHGTLVINPPDQHQTSIEGNCHYGRWVIDGTWTGEDGAAKLVAGFFQGKDTNRRAGESCLQSDTLVQFTVAFDGPIPPQPFSGYIFSREPSLMAGLTWWNGFPFGWYAQKR